MEPRIQYARTSDGVNIAYSTVGEGRPFIAIAPPGFNHAELNWQMFGALNEALAAMFHVVNYDSRGNGLSDRSAVDFSMDAMIRDLEAVVERSGFETFVLVSWATAVPIGVTYAVTHPERVSHLILIDGYASVSDFAESTVYKTGVALLDADWVLFTETFAQVLWAWPDPEFARRYAEFIRACCEPEAMRTLWKAWESLDVSALLPSVTTPTLIVHNKNNRWFPVDVGQRLAAAVPNARLTLIDDMSWAPVPNLIDAFVGEGQPREPSLPSGMTAILFADIVDSTALTERLGDTAFRAKARELDGALQAVIREGGGTPVEGKLLGDGVLAVFTSARQAIAAALKCGVAGEEGGLPLHLGIHAGDVIEEDGNVFGGAVNIAARIADESAPGEVLVSRTVTDLARTSAGVAFEDRGEHELKGVAGPQCVFAVRKDGE
ncbi:MAG TPA: adenylate/guanylate cyclase domain-containing protein [Dehalococcoidia bacterium]|nr:adenylate/guanylate cyclase domain-containing protein [Dehalococcoidia bacterium]